MIQITPQMRILVAVDAQNFRKGIDGLRYRSVTVHAGLSCNRCMAGGPNCLQRFSGENRESEGAAACQRQSKADEENDAVGV